MRITFLRPNFADTRSVDAAEPLAFAVLAGLTPSDVEMDFFDERLEALPFEHQTDLVAITVNTYTARRSYEVAGHFRRRGIPVVVGGYHPTFLPEEALQYVDAVVLGDAENVWPLVVEDARRHQLQPIYKADGKLSLIGRRFERSIFSGKRYKPVAQVQYGVGCRFACDFCSTHLFYGPHLYQRPLNEVVAEIETLRTKYVVFVDDNLLISRERALELFEALIPLKIKWTGQISIDVASDESLIKAMKRSGCVVAFVGFESLVKENMQSMQKGWANRHGSYADAVHKFQENGIMVWGGFVFGYDQDTPDIFDRTVEFAIDARLMLVNFVPITPTPGTILYKRMEQEGRLLYPRWWLDPAYRYGQAVFRPAKMAPEQLTEGCLRARHTLYSYSSIFKRSFEAKSTGSSIENTLLYWASNLLYRRELGNKLGHSLGSTET